MPHVRVFQCPRCHEFISTDAKTCRFCSTAIDAHTAQLAADTEDKENERYMRRGYARHMLKGGALFAVGFAVTIGAISAAAYSSPPCNLSFIDCVTIAVLSAVVESPLGRYLIFICGPLMLYAAGDFIYGLAGLLRELR